MTQRYRLTMAGVYEDDAGDWVKYEDLKKANDRVVKLEAANRKLWRHYVELRPARGITFDLEGM